MNKTKLTAAVGGVLAGMLMCGSQAFALPSDTETAEPKPAVQTVTTEEVANCNDVAKDFSRALILKMNQGKWADDLDATRSVQVLDQDENSVTVRVPVIYKDRNNNAEYEGAVENPMIVPGAQQEGFLYVCNNGTDTMKANVKAYIVNAKMSGDVATKDDPFYHDLKVNDRPFVDYLDEDVLIGEKELGQLEVMKVPLSYSFDAEAVSGNRAGENAKDINTGKANEYAAGTRVASVDIKVQLDGIPDPEKPKDPEKPQEKPATPDAPATPEKPADPEDPVTKAPLRGAVTGEGFSENNSAMILAGSLIIVVGLGATGVAMYRKREKTE